LASDKFSILFPKLKEFVRECKFADDKDVICTANCCLEEQDQKFLCIGMRALEKCFTKWSSVAGDCVEK